MTLKRIKYKGTKKSLPNIHCDEVDMIYVTRTNRTAFREPSPLYLFTYNDDMYIGVCHLFKLNMFMYLNDLDNDFCEFYPGKKEFEILKELDPTYYLFDYDETMKGDLDEFSDYELDLIKNWNREITLRKLLDTEINVVPLNYKIRNNVKKEMIY